MDFIVELRQRCKAKKNRFINQPTFLVQPTIHYEVHYFPDNIYMNLRSYEPLFFALFLGEGPDDCRKIFITEFLSETLIPQSHYENILNAFASKATSIATDPRNSGSNSIDLTLSVRVIWIQHGRPVRFSNRLPATKESVKGLKSVIYNNNNDDGDSGSECAICLKEFQVGEKITRMPCFHCYHGDCIEKWLINNHLCPFCRFPLPVSQEVPWPAAAPAGAGTTTTTFSFAFGSNNHGIAM